MASFAGAATARVRRRRAHDESSAHSNGHGRNGEAAGPLPDERSVAALTRGLGYFSLALGTTQLAAPGLVDKLIGVTDDGTSRRWQRIVGLQELSAAAGILPRERPIEWLWARTSGDVVHLAMLARAYRNRRDSAPRLAIAMASVVGCFAADAFASTRMTSDPKLRQEVPRVKGKASITIRAPREELLEQWRRFEQDPQGESRLGPLEILAGDPQRGVEWRTADGAAHKAHGTLRLADAPAGRGTEIHASIEFAAPGGSLGAAVMKVAGDEPLQQLRDDLRRFKQLIETGEIARSDGAPTGASAKLQPKQHPAQPPANVNA
ncbi:MAG TPA: hypothetical protein VGD00_09685 [Solirubrobacteraceae bacterium]